jgi:NAD+ kinase
MKVGIYGQFYHKGSEQYIQQLLDILSQQKFDVVIEENFLEIIKENKTITRDYPDFTTFRELDNTFAFFFSIGGDGTILKSVNLIKNLDIPVIGINTGRLGFLATIQKEEIGQMIEALVKDKFSISKRDILTVQTEPATKALKDENFALNEVAISRKNTTSMITVETWLNGKYLNAYWADGLIISTPTGSTGYSMSCGGSIITPETKVTTLAPIAPHNLNARPMVIPNDTEMRFKVSGREDEFLISLDSRLTSLSKEKTIIIKKAPFTIGLVLLHEDSFIKTLRKKLLWGEDKRNQKQ